MMETGMAPMDDRIRSEARHATTPFQALTFYLGSLMIRRFQDLTTTESDEPVQGIRIELTEEEVRHYQTR
jgi:hypothetical protein